MTTPSAAEGVPSASTLEAAEAYDHLVDKPMSIRDRNKIAFLAGVSFRDANPSPEVLALVEALQKSYELLRQRDVCLNDRNKALGWMYKALAAFELAKGGK